MSYFDGDDNSYNYGSWIYVGGDINNISWSKVGKTTNGLNTRHTSAQNPGYFIYAAFQLIRGSVHEIESRVLKYLEVDCGLERIPHFSTGSPSECFYLNPEETICLVEDFIQDKFGSCVVYENTLHGGMSRYQCCDDIRRYFRGDSVFKPRHLSLRKNNYFTGNQEAYEVNLGDDCYMDVASGMIIYREDD